MDSKVFLLPDMEHEICFEAYNEFHLDRLPKVIYRTGDWTDFADILDRFFIAELHSVYESTGKVKLDVLSIKSILKHIDAAIDGYENVNKEFVSNYCDPDISHSVVDYKKDTFIATIDEDTYLKLVDMSKILHKVFDNYKWNRYRVYVVRYKM